MAAETLSLQQVHDAFLNLEEEAGLWELRAYGRRYWHNIRYDVWGAVQRSLGLSGVKHGSWRSRPLSTWITPRPSHWADAVRRSTWHDLEPADLLVFNHPRHVLDDGAWRCAYSDPLLANLPHSRWVIEQGFQGLHYLPNRTQGLKYIEWAKLRAYTKFALRDGWRGGRLAAVDRREVVRWVQLLRARLGGGPDDEKALSLVRIAIRRIVALTELFERLLDDVQPRVVVHVVHYNFRSMVMTPLAKARGIPVVEVQHGFIGPTHLAYNTAPGRQPEAFPDYLLLFGQLWREITPGLPLPEERTPSIGFARLESMRTVQQSRPASAPFEVLFVSQSAVGEALTRIAAELAERVDPARFRIVVKLHPSEASGWRQRYPWLARAKVSVKDAPTDDIYQQLARAQVQVGVYSTALFEGLAFGLPTAIMALPGHEDMRVLTSRGLATLVHDVEGLARYLESSPEPAPSEALSSIWAPGARERFRTFIQELIGSPNLGQWI
jgi:hypothetical protein